MKNRILISGIILSALGFFFTACSGNKAVFKTVDAASATSIAAKRNMVVLDVRTPEEFSEGHLPKAINIDFLNPSFTDNINKLDKKKRYLVYCRSGHRSTQAVEVMKAQNFKNVTNMLGGYSKWQGPTGQ